MSKRASHEAGAMKRTKYRIARIRALLSAISADWDDSGAQSISNGAELLIANLDEFSTDATADYADWKQRAKEGFE